jgi:hypothetical protein
MIRNLMVTTMARKSVKPVDRKRASARAASAAVRIKPGPRKKVVEGAPPPRHTTHKVRAAGFQARASYPVRDANVDRLISERARVRPAASAAMNWVPVGPTNMGAMHGSCRPSCESRHFVYWFGGRRCVAQ